MNERKKPKKPNQEEINRQVRQLMNKPGWDPRRHVSEQPLEALQRLDQEARNEEIFADASTQCESCQVLRAKLHDETALCQEHLAQAMGFD